MFERLSQRIRYFPWWVMHPVMFHRSEQHRRAVNLLVKDLLDEELDGVEIVYPGDEGTLYARAERGES